MSRLSLRNLWRLRQERDDNDPSNSPISHWIRPQKLDHPAAPQFRIGFVYASFLVTFQYHIEFVHKFYPAATPRFRIGYVCV